jgi:hypothetical protein
VCDYFFDMALAIFLPRLDECWVNLYRCVETSPVYGSRGKDPRFTVVILKMVPHLKHIHFKIGYANIPSMALKLVENKLFQFGRNFRFAGFHFAFGLEFLSCSERGRQTGRISR